MIKGVPCTHIIGLVIYDLPGRDCGGDASGGEYDTGELDRYKAEYIDPLREIFLANPNTAIALAIEPDSLPNAITSLIHPRCAASVQEYKDGIAYALKQFDLPNVVQYIDAGNGNWLGWDPNVAPAAKVIADVWKAAGKPKSCKGIVTNVSNWNAWSMIPGEFENFKDAQYNKAQDEKRYIHLLGAQLAANGMPNHAIVDTSRNGRVGLRTYGGNWCNVKGAGFGIRPTSETDDDLCDAFVWVKVGGESDGGSDPSLPGYDPTCANADAFIPSPRAGSWNQAQFEEPGCTSGCDAPPASDSPTTTPVTTDDDDDNWGPDDYIPCDYTKTFENLDDLNAASDGMRTECLAAYAMSTLITMLDTAYDNYTSVNDGYDEEFGYYVTYIQKLVPIVLDKSFMFNVTKVAQYGNISPPGPGMSSLGNAGLAPDWVVLGDHKITKSVTMRGASRTFEYQFSGYPIENPEISVPNPKDLVTKGLGSIPELRLSMQATYLEIVLGIVVLMFVPVVGEEVALTMGLASLARTIAITGELGNAALAIYDTVNDPKSAVINILGMLVGVGAIAKVERSGKGLGDVAKVRRGMSEADIAGLGSVFKNSDDKLQAIIKVCRRALKQKKGKWCEEANRGDVRFDLDDPSQTRKRGVVNNPNKEQISTTCFLNWEIVQVITSNTIIGKTNLTSSLSVSVVHQFSIDNTSTKDTHGSRQVSQANFELVPAILVLLNARHHREEAVPDCVVDTTQDNDEGRVLPEHDLERSQWVSESHTSFRLFGSTVDGLPFPNIRKTYPAWPKEHPLLQGKLSRSALRAVAHNATSSFWQATGYEAYIDSTKDDEAPEYPLLSTASPGYQTAEYRTK
ncbi:hypothetical protein D6D10_08112 [Aureobasidium pullulans]|uniref:Glucanase n=1 Tax=Aureobasidium pullulans TaxID=5580 RepID=A0A4S9EGK5_AURPU|nr:hypothetical protein D6D10_08112 [Aureobasidium pullulans]